MVTFAFETDAVSLPRGVFTRALRQRVSWRGRPIRALSQGAFRPYLFPVLTPAGVCVTSEAPIDHPHHNSIAVGADHFVCMLPYSTDKLDEAAYNFFVNETFQGRAAGRTLAVSARSEELSEGHLRILQTVEWRGPSEWGAPEGRLLAEEARTIEVFPGEVTNVIDIRSQLRPTQWDIAIGPTRHAYFTVRLADGLRVANGGALVDSEGRSGATAIVGQTAAWVDMSGPASHGYKAGIAVLPHRSTTGLPWSADDGGTINVNPFWRERRFLKCGRSLELAIRVVAHDGDAQEARLSQLYESFKPELDL